MTYPPYSEMPVPGNKRIMGGENHNQPWTRIVFVDGSELLVHWDGRYEVAGIQGSDRVTVYCPQGRRLHFSWQIIRMIEHQNEQEEQS